MEKQQIAAGFARARKTYDREARVQHQAAAEMLRLLRDYASPDDLADGALLEVGCGTGIYSRLLQQAFHPQEMWLNDLCTEMQQSLNDL